jgi:hypothetical protein
MMLSTPQTPFDTLCTLLRPDSSLRMDVAGIPPHEWEAIAALSLAHGVSAMLLERLRSRGVASGIPTSILTDLEAVRVRTAMRNVRLYAELARVMRALRDHDLPFILLKGAHLAELVYENLSLRGMGDVDLLVRESHLAAVKEVIRGLGYSQYNKTAEKMKSASAHHLVPFEKEGAAPIEVHWTLPSIARVGAEPVELWERARPAEIAGCRALVLAPDDLLLHTCVHASLHHRFGIGLRPLTDITAILAKYNGALDWDRLYRSAEQWHLSKSVSLTLRVASELVGAPVPDNALTQLQVNPELIRWAKHQVLTRSNELGDAASVSPRLARFWATPTIGGKVQQLWRIAFPPREEIARMYSLSPDSLKIYSAYPVMWKDLFLLRGRAVWRLIRRREESVAKARLFQELLDTETK